VTRRTIRPTWRGTDDQARQGSGGHARRRRRGHPRTAPRRVAHDPRARVPRPLAHPCPTRGDMEAELRRLRAERPPIQRALDEVDAVVAEVEKLRAELDDVRIGQGGTAELEARLVALEQREAARVESFRIGVSAIAHGSFADEAEVRRACARFAGNAPVATSRGLDGRGALPRSRRLLGRCHARDPALGGARHPRFGCRRAEGHGVEQRAQEVECAVTRASSGRALVDGRAPAAAARTEAAYRPCGTGPTPPRSRGHHRRRCRSPRPPTGPRTR
jgi:hypothetical protein